MPMQDLERLEWEPPDIPPTWPQYLNPLLLVYLLYRFFEWIFTELIDRPNAKAQAKEQERRWGR